jgi:hypothetical protein
MCSSGGKTKKNYEVQIYQKKKSSEPQTGHYEDMKKTSYVCAREPVNFIWTSNNNFS